ncbi:MAG: potassium channel family protein [Acidobacteriota bacterium]|jgi:uncharacterized membrane protein|nr:potassium channel family protein [Acidobacteriota bacterium]
MTEPAASTEAAERDQFQVDRIAFFSDAIFAIAITLLVLEIKVPHLEPGAGEAGAARALLGQAFKASGFVASFLVIGTYWTAHHRLFRWVNGYDRGLVWRNLWFLLAVSFIPFPTAFFSEYPTYETSLILYTASLGLVGVGLARVVRHIRKRRLYSAGLPAGEMEQNQRRAWAVPSVCLLAIVISFWSQPIARLSLLAIPLAVWLFGRGWAGKDIQGHKGLQGQQGRTPRDRG